MAIFTQYSFSQSHGTKSMQFRFSGKCLPNRQTRTSCKVLLYDSFFALTQARLTFAGKTGNKNWNVPIAVPPDQYKTRWNRKKDEQLSTRRTWLFSIFRSSSFRLTRRTVVIASPVIYTVTRIGGTIERASHGTYGWMVFRRRLVGSWSFTKCCFLAKFSRRSSFYEVLTI